MGHWYTIHFPLQVLLLHERGAWQRGVAAPGHAPAERDRVHTADGLLPDALARERAHHGAVGRSPATHAILTVVKTGELVFQT